MQVLVLLALTQAAGAWPAVAPLDTLVQVAHLTPVKIEVPIQSVAGDPLYVIFCRDGDWDMSNDVNYSGVLDCRLFPAGRGEVEENLLVEERGIAAWYSRARMFANELRGACADYPEYGRVRHFLLRGMRLTVEFRDAVFAAAGGLEAYTVRFRVERSATALRDIAESSGYLDPGRHVPGRSCAHVQRGEEWPR